MAKERTSRCMKEQIKTLFEKGYGVRAIARSLHVGRRTVRRVLGTERMVKSLEQGRAGWEAQVDWSRVQDEVSRRGVTIKQLHREWAPEVLYLSFWREFRRQIPIQPEATIRLHHKPGDKVQTDFCDGLYITDRFTGKKTLTQFFCGVLPFSSYTFGVFVFDQKLKTFIDVHDQMWAYFGGVTTYEVVDNLKSGVKTAHYYDPDVNPTFCAYANHIGFAVLPARPYKPRYKATAETSIGVVQRQFFQEVRDRVFYSLNELNLAWRLYGERLNSDTMKDYGVSRLERFQEEKKHLRGLPLTRFELHTWKTAKVHPDCHVQVANNFYSVPNRYVGLPVRVRMSAKLVEVFSEEGETLCAHALLHGRGLFSTVEAHYPEAKLQSARFDVHHALLSAETIGPKTHDLVKELLSGEHPLRYLRRVQGILRLIRSHKVNKDAMEYACAQASIFNKKRLFYIKQCALYFMNDRIPTLVRTPCRDQGTLHLHGTQEGGAR